MVANERKKRKSGLVGSITTDPEDLYPVEWDAQQYEGRKVIVRVDGNGEPSGYDASSTSIFKSYFFIRWRSFDPSSHREYAECVIAPLKPKEILLRLDEGAVGNGSRRGSKYVMIPVNTVYFLNFEIANRMGLDPHPEQDIYFPERIRVIPEAIWQPRICQAPVFEDSKRIMVTNRATCRIAKSKLEEVPVLGNGIELRKSRIPSGGRGVYASRDFHANELVTLYFGHVFGETERKHMQEMSLGTHCKPLQYKLSYLDGIKEGFLGMPAGQLLNEGGNKLFQNCDWITLEIYPSSGEKVVGIRATRHVYEGEELYVSYGSKFWSEQGQVPEEPPPVESKKISDTS